MEYKSFNDIYLMNEFDGDEDILVEMIRMFETGLNDILGPIRESIMSRNAGMLKINAHTIKGILANFYAEEGKMLAYELEKRGELSAFDDALELLNKLENQLQLILFELKKFQAKLVNQT